LDDVIEASVEMVVTHSQRCCLNGTAHGTGVVKNRHSTDSESDGRLYEEEGGSSGSDSRNAGAKRVG
jgi:hypothetical protein